MHDSILLPLQKAGIDETLLAQLRAPLVLTGDFASDAASHGMLWTALGEVRRRLRGRGGDNDLDVAVRDYECETREDFLDLHVEELYGRLTNDYRSFVRAEALVLDAADIVPGLVPSRAEMREERKLRLAEKRGLELQQAILCSKIGASQKAGSHLCHAMLLPREESAEALARFRRDGRLDLGRARLERRGAAAHVIMSQPERLNCEDDTTYPALEVAVDVALMDRDIRIGVLRGDFAAKRPDKRYFGSGINLTALYWGQVSYMFYVGRNLGPINKMFRGIARPNRDPSEVGGGTLEKLWIGAVDGFAIGGACQFVLVMDHVIAERGAYVTLPARKEGIVPGMANLRMPRFIGDRLTREAIMNDQRIDFDTPAGRMLCNEIVETEEMDAAIDKAVERLTNSGMVSASGNRRALRMAVEPFDLFRQYFAVYAREQGYCQVSPALVANLERYWRAHERKAG